MENPRQNGLLSKNKDATKVPIIDIKYNAVHFVFPPVKRDLKNFPGPFTSEIELKKHTPPNAKKKLNLCGTSNTLDM